MKNYYQFLGVDYNATNEEIKKSFKMYAAKLHPDKHNGDKFFEDRFKEIYEAYEILASADKRRIYDLELKRKELNAQNFGNKEMIFKKKEQELIIKEKTLLKKEKELKSKIEEINKKEERIRKESNELFINKIKDNENYSHIELHVPRPSIKKVQVKSWLKNVGEYIKPGDAIVRLQTEKKDFFEIKSDIEGFIIYTVKIGEILNPGNMLAIIGK